MHMNQLGKKRSRLGAFLDNQEITQNDAAMRAGVNKETMSKLCNDDEYVPTFRTISKIMKTIREIKPEANVSDFFNI